MVEGTEEVIWVKDGSTLKHIGKHSHTNEYTKITTLDLKP